jgi:hypothetical protein
MNELKKKLEITFQKYSKEYELVCEKSDGMNALHTLQINSLKFDSINKKLIKEVTEKLNVHIEKNPNQDKDKIVSVGQEYIKNFSLKLGNL